MLVLLRECWLTTIFLLLHLCLRILSPLHLFPLSLALLRWEHPGCPLRFPHMRQAQTQRKKASLYVFFRYAQFFLLNIFMRVLYIH